MKGVTAKDPPKAEPGTTKNAVACDRLLREMRARGFEAARGSEERMNHEAIDPEEDSNRRIRSRLVFRSKNLSRRVLSIHFASPFPKGGLPSAVFVRSNSRSSERRPSSSTRDSCAPLFRAITIRSRSRSSSDRCWRNHARTRRLKRFRTTALPTLRLAVIPSLHPEGLTDSKRPELLGLSNRFAV